jgi:uncharacterized protein YecE (DUF72 family)
LREYLIGTGGWAYFHVPRLRPLTAYSRIFDFVEVNSTFYQIPPSAEVEEWRKIVPPEFKFAVRAHRSITHTHNLQPVQPVFEAFKQMTRICEVLKAEILHLQTPPKFEPSQRSVKDVRNLLSSINLGKLRLALETRGTGKNALPSNLVRTMQDFNMVHCVDLSRGEMPAYESDILYTRLFGKGKHNVYQPTDNELAEIDNKASSSKSDKIVMSFHFVRMYKDAARLKSYKQTGKFPMVTKSTGITSLGEVLNEDAEFPSTKQELISNQGWKIFDMTKTEKARVDDLLQRLPEGKYNSVSEVLDKLAGSILG